jgi:hypothetical protein
MGPIPNRLQTFDLGSAIVYREGEMSKVFKVLANITALFLFAGGLLGMISRMIVWFGTTGFTGTGTEMAYLALQFVYIAAWFVSAVVVMKLSQTLK